MKLPRPLENDQERLEAVKKAEKLNRKHEKTHIRLNWPPPIPVVPKETVAIWGWALGPKPERIEPVFEGREEGQEEDEEGESNEEEGEGEGELEGDGEGVEGARRVPTEPPNYNRVQTYDVEEGTGVTPLGTPIPKLHGDPEERARRWDKAAQLEEQFHQTKYKEALATAERQFVRRSGYREKRDRERREMEADAAAGIEDGIKKERMRMDAIEHIEHYAKVTGEDVSEWYKELERPEWGVAEGWRPTHIHKGGVRPRSGVRSSFREGVMELREADAVGVKIGGGSGAKYEQLRIGSGPSDEPVGIGGGSEKAKHLIWAEGDESERGGIERDPNEVPTRGNRLGFGRPIPESRAWNGKTDPRYVPNNEDPLWQDPRPPWQQRDVPLRAGFGHARAIESSAYGSRGGYGTQGRGGYGTQGRGGYGSSGGAPTTGFGLRSKSDDAEGRSQPFFGSGAESRGGYQPDRAPRERSFGIRSEGTTGGTGERSFTPRDDFSSRREGYGTSGNSFADRGQSRSDEYTPRASSDRYTDRGNSFASRELPRHVDDASREGGFRARESEYSTRDGDSAVRSSRESGYRTREGDSATRPPRDGGSSRREDGSGVREGGYMSRSGGSSPREVGYPIRDGDFSSRPPREREGGFSSREDGSGLREGGFTSRTGGFSLREGGYPTRDSELSSRPSREREGGYSSREDGFPARDSGFTPREDRSSSRNDSYRTRDGSFTPRDDRYDNGNSDRRPRSESYQTRPSREDRYPPARDDARDDRFARDDSLPPRLRAPVPTQSVPSSNVDPSPRQSVGVKSADERRGPLSVSEEAAKLLDQTSGRARYSGGASRDIESSPGGGGYASGGSREQRWTERSSRDDAGYRQREERSGGFGGGGSGGFDDARREGSGGRAGCEGRGRDSGGEGRGEGFGRPRTSRNVARSEPYL